MLADATSSMLIMFSISLFIFSYTWVYLGRPARHHPQSQSPRAGSGRDVAIGTAPVELHRSPAPGATQSHERPALSSVSHFSPVAYTAFAITPPPPEGPNLHNGSRATTSFPFLPTRPTSQAAQSPFEGAVIASSVTCRCLRLPASKSRTRYLSAGRRI